MLGRCPKPFRTGLPTAKVLAEVPLNRPKIYVSGLACNIAEMLHDMEDLYETIQALSVGEVTFDTA